MSRLQFTQNDLQDVLRDMGQSIDPSQLPFFLRAVDQIIAEDYNSSLSDDPHNQSIFSSLCVNENVQPRLGSTASSSSSSPSDCLSPIATRVRTKKGNQLRNIAGSQNVSHELDGQVQRALKNAFDVIESANATCSAIDVLCKAMQSTDDDFDTDFDSEFSSSRKKSDEDEKKDEKVENEAETEEGDDEEEDIEDEEDKENTDETISEKFEKMLQMDPSVRKVLNPGPGRLPYKYDPVTRYHLYREEWERKPTPGEKKRLALRWKVREFMLRYDAPKLQAIEAPVQHPKDWSPRPYLD